MKMAVRNEKNVPGVVVPAITCEPPYQITAATPTAARNSMIGERISSVRTDRSMTL